ncbi:uncharacterized protein LOC129794333 [Lutzomyia longipalpis]|uniref:Uncharacterized protein n=1 Tax=Lutzomyia longipalpis TaxID=7200 RepID=A0A1B0CE29_LUTLO|nr:uncharacterized protein LOC129794333 [Lutzomyia longipalpis]XP_055691109.1 uncharacterized protein LOC129794333 [Lutzomyia longipalpis]
MHAMGIHSALAVKRQRKRRDDQKKKRERRHSLQSADSLDTNASSTRRRYGRYGLRKRNTENSLLDQQVVSSIGMLHIGVVFVVFGIFLLGAGILPDDMSSFNLFALETWWNELVCTGAFAIGLGIFLIILNSFISKREETDLEEYVQRQLTRSRSGHRLERDVETGCLATRQHHKSRLQKDLLHSPATESSNEPLSSTNTHDGPLGGDILLEQILEEDNRYDERSGEIVSSLSSDKKFLLGNGHTNSVTITNI